jgi:hypothetical protein
MVCQRNAKAGAFLRPEEAGPGSGEEDGARLLPGGSGERGAMQGSGIIMVQSRRKAAQIHLLSGSCARGPGTQATECRVAVSKQLDCR